MIIKERLQELIDEGATIYEVKYGKVNPVSLKNKIRFVSERYPVIVFEPRPNEKYKHHKYFDKLYETLFEAEWIAKTHAERTEKFEPPCELKDNEKYKFTTAKGGKMSISKFIRQSGDVEWWLSYVGTHRTFYSYTEAVEYARKLFIGEE
jgi:hypothetical protein